MKLVLVHWLDTCAAHGWEDREDRLRDYAPSANVSVGFLIRDTKEHITLAGDISGTGQVGCTTCIPRAVVTKIEHLRDVKEP